MEEGPERDCVWLRPLPLASDVSSSFFRVLLNRRPANRAAAAEVSEAKQHTVSPRRPKHKGTKSRMAGDFAQASATRESVTYGWGLWIGSALPQSDLGLQQAQFESLFL